MANPKVRITLSILLGVWLVMMLVRSISEIADINDFEVYYFAGELAADHDPRLYELKSPEKNRPFLYPPAAAIMFIPLTWVPQVVAGVIFSFLKVLAAAILLAGAIKYSAAAPRGPTWALLLIAATLFLNYRPFNNDFGNGQVNIVVAAFAAGGVWIMMTGEKRLSWIGAVCLSVAVALKLTPLLLLAVPFLHRKWRDFGLTLIFSVFLLFVLPVAWFGSDAIGPMREEFNAESMESLMSARGSDRQVSINEMLIFTIAQVKADPDLILEDGDELYRFENGEKIRVRLPPPFSDRTAKLIWLTEGLLVGVLFLVGRWMLFRGRKFDWTWDLAMLCVLMLLLSPLVRKAHLVVLAVPMGWIVTRMGMVWHQAGTLKDAWKQRRNLWIGVGTILALSYASEELPIPVPGLFPMPYRPGLFLLCIVLVVMLCAMATLQPMEDSQ